MHRMTITDLMLLPIFITITVAIAMLMRPSTTNPITQRYYQPALIVKIIGALSLGVIYQFYYGGGDTFNFFHDSYFIWQAFLNNPLAGLKIIFQGGNLLDPQQLPYLTSTYFHIDSKTFFVIRIGALFGLFTFHHYTGIAILFALFSFTGVWAMYRTFFVMYPPLHRPLALACLFLPSVFFWGSGYMKDSVTLGALGWLFYSFYWGVMRRKKVIYHSIVMLLSAWLIHRIKTYILACFLPTMVLWFFLSFRQKMTPGAARAMILPLLLLLALPIGYVIVDQITANSVYSIDNLARTAQVSSDWLLYVSEKQGGSAYSLGKLDGTWQGTLSKFPAAVWVTLFRPYLWEVRNPVMFLSSLEVLFFLFMTFRLLWQMRKYLPQLYLQLIQEPILLSCFIFAILFSFGVGISSYNFGTLVRYKIPMMPFYLSALYILRYRINGRTSLI